MIASLRKLFRAADALPRPAVPAGQRVYAVGDVHGRADLFAAIIVAIEADAAARGAGKNQFIMLGDLVDRGPDSKRAVRLARDWSARRGARLIAANHEEMLLQSLTDRDVLKQFLKWGGHETALSYVADRDTWNAADLDTAQHLLRAHIPDADLAYFRAAENAISVGDYLFVHAGIAPGVPLDQQRTKDLLWIREPFLSSRADHGVVVVHGHTITEEAEIFANRIGIDTGAYASGRLTALGLEGTARWLIEARESEGTVITTRQDIT
jgi:serine/threonine protein phosphatase 1